MAKTRLLVVQVAALGFGLLREHLGGSAWKGFSVGSADAVFPAVTCTAQATFRTGALPANHGMVFNGHYIREFRRPSFWEQSAALVEGPRIWDDFRAGGGTVGMLFWQQSLGENVDLLLSPAPIHTHGGGLIDTVYSQPEGLYERLCQRLGKRFKLSSYWGPLARSASTEWIARATEEVLRSPEAPDLLLTYLPHLDYDLQKYGPRTKQANRALIRVLALLDSMLQRARNAGYQVLVFGDYAIGEAGTAVHPNRLLHGKGWLKTRNIHGRLYPDFYTSDAFAVVDHEIAHVYLRDPARTAEVADTLRSLPCTKVLCGDELAEYGVKSRRSGEIVLLGTEGAWFAYPWWEARKEAPDYATHIDIHNKPGYDPCELFFGWPPFSVSTDVTRVRGTHGCVGPDRRVAWFSDLEIDSSVDTLLDLAAGVRDYLDHHEQ